MKLLNKVKQKLDWEKYYDPDFKWFYTKFPNKDINDPNFLITFHKKLDWFSVLRLYKLKKSTIEAVLDYEYNNFDIFVFIDEFLYNQNFSKEMFEKYETKIIEYSLDKSKYRYDWQYIIRKKKPFITFEFLEKYKHKIFTDKFPWKSFCTSSVFKHNKEFFKAMKNI
jgi:hypothetical protein